MSLIFIDHTFFRNFTRPRPFVTPVNVPPETFLFGCLLTWSSKTSSVSDDVTNTQPPPPYLLLYYRCRIPFPVLNFFFDFIHNGGIGQGRRSTLRYTLPICLNFDVSSFKFTSPSQVQVTLMLYIS